MQLFESRQCRDRAASLFSEWKVKIEAKVPFAIVEHVGSTAIHGALAKGDIDLYVEVPRETHAAAISIIETMGFKVKQDTHRDSELCMLEHHDITDLAIQVVARGSKYSLFLKFRDALNRNKHLVAQYNALKQSSVDVTQEQYREIKSQFIKGVIGDL